MRPAVSGGDVHVRLSSAEIRKLDQIAEREDRSVSSVVRRLISGALRRVKSGKR